MRSRHTAKRGSRSIRARSTVVGESIPAGLYTTGIDSQGACQFKVRTERIPLVAVRISVRGYDRGQSVKSLKRNHRNLVRALTGADPGFREISSLRIIGKGENATGSFVCQTHATRQNLYIVPYVTGYEQTESRFIIKSTSNGTTQHDKDSHTAKRINRGSKNGSRERQVDDLPTANEIDRREAGADGKIEPRMPIGGIKELQRMG